MLCLEWDTVPEASCDNEMFLKRSEIDYDAIFILQKPAVFSYLFYVYLTSSDLVKIRIIEDITSKEYILWNPPLLTLR